MTIVSAAQLSRRELGRLGHNTPLDVRRDRRQTREAVNRSLAVHDEAIGDDDPIVEAALQSEHLAS